MSDAHVFVAISQTVPASLRSRFGRYILNVLIGVDVLADAILGGPAYMTISARVGESINSGGWASRVPWPAWWRAHCAAAIYTAIV